MIIDFNVADIRRLVCTLCSSMSTPHRRTCFIFWIENTSCPHNLSCIVKCVVEESFWPPPNQYGVAVIIVVQ